MKKKSASQGPLAIMLMGATSFIGCGLSGPANSGKSEATSQCVAALANQTPKLEEEYLPKVLACEVGNLPGLNAAMAQAIAARSYAYYVMGGRTLTPTTRDQVVECENEVTDLHRDAVNATRGIIMRNLHEGVSHPVAGFYVSGSADLSDQCIGNRGDTSENGSTERRVSYQSIPGVQASIDHLLSESVEASEHSGWPGSPSYVGTMSQHAAICLGERFSAVGSFVGAASAIGLRDALNADLHPVEVILRRFYKPEAGPQNLDFARLRDSSSTENLSRCDMPTRDAYADPQLLGDLLVEGAEAAESSDIEAPVLADVELNASIHEAAPRIGKDCPSWPSVSITASNIPADQPCLTLGIYVRATGERDAQSFREVGGGNTNASNCRMVEVSENTNADRTITWTPALCGDGPSTNPANAQLRVQLKSSNGNSHGSWTCTGLDGVARQKLTCTDG